MCFRKVPNKHFPKMNKVAVVALIVAISISLPVCFAQANIKTRAKEFINRNHLRIPPMLRLLFHTCLGGCSGCINWKDSSNRGLEAIYRDARSFCQTQISSLSLADCIVALGTSAAEIGMRKAGITRASIPFEEGRITCLNPDSYEEEKTFPKGDDPNAIDILISAFALNRREAVALLGAHSLGSAKRANSGFQGAWDNTQTTLDNGFFQNLFQNRWIFRRIGNNPQWNSASSAHMMLLSDMALLRDVTYGANKQPTCTAVARCPFSNDANLVRTYAKDMNAWSTDFITAFAKMVKIPQGGS